MSKMRYFRRGVNGRLVFSSKENATHISDPGAPKGKKIVPIRGSIERSIRIGEIERKAKERSRQAREKSGRKNQSEYFARRQAVTHTPYTGDPNIRTEIVKTDKEKLREQIRRELENPTVREAKIHSTDEEFIYDEQVEKKFGLNEEAQRKIYDLLKSANEMGILIDEMTDGVVAPKFSLRLDNIKDYETIMRRVASAETVLRSDYLENLARDYKQDFMYNFRDVIEPDLYEKFRQTIEGIDDMEFLRYLKNNKVEYLAYGFDSVITTYGYEFIEGEINAIISAFR